MNIIHINTARMLKKKYCGKTFVRKDLVQEQGKKSVCKLSNG